MRNWQAQPHGGARIVKLVYWQCGIAEIEPHTTTSNKKSPQYVHIFIQNFDNSYAEILSENIIWLLGAQTW